MGNMTKMFYPNHPELGSTQSVYDENANVTEVIDAKGHKTSYVYDELDRRVRTTLHDGQFWEYSYDANGNQLMELTPNGEKTEQTYDALNRVKQLTERAADGSISRQISYSYDANSNIASESSGGNTISYNYDEINRVSSVTDVYGKTISYAYDKAGNRTGLTYPGNKTIQYSYDEADRLDGLTDWLNKTTQYTRNKAGQTTEVLNGNGTKTQYVYDEVGRLTLLSNLQANGSVMSRHDMTLDEGGNITQATVTLPLTPELPTSLNSMAYDNNNRLQTADGKSYTHDGTGRIVEEDQAGVQTIYNFDINDHISSITREGTTLSSYGYDLNDNRIQQVQNGVETRYVIDQLASLPNVVAETDAAGLISRYYLYGEGLVAQIDAAGESHYYHFDPTGHTLALTDALGNVTDKYAYAPYGFTTVSGSTHNPFKYVGRHGVMDDGNGLHYMRARYYSEEIKRFVSLDGLHGDIVNGQALNRYAYVLGNPVMGVDPSGLETGNVNSDLDKELSRWRKIFKEQKSLTVKKFSLKKIKAIRKKIQLINLASDSVRISSLITLNPSVSKCEGSDKECYYKRLKYGELIQPKTEREAKERGCQLMDSNLSLYHTQYKQSWNNKKYACSDGSESIFKIDGTLDTSIANRGTYNYSDPINDASGHAKYDVIPYYLYGTGDDDGFSPANTLDRIINPVLEHYILKPLSTW